MKTHHRIFFNDSKQMNDVESNSADMAVTSPPYPMVEMWDSTFASQNPAIADHLAAGRGSKAFVLMHELLDCVWRELYRVLKPGGLACINVGDAVRTVDDQFRLYSNHSRILTSLQEIGFSALPGILWRKQTNAPNKFMGSGMLPPGAYVTLEHEHILIVRKGNKREFASETNRIRRRQSALFWEERNVWFSDIWMDLKGVGQELNGNEVRQRSGAFPVELPFRLINMFSLYQDTIIDPFLGTGTTMLAAAGSGRNSIGFEIDSSLKSRISDELIKGLHFAQNRLQSRIQSHLDFVENRFQNSKSPMKYTNRHYQFPVMTRQEVELLFYPLESIERTSSDRFEAIYSEPLDETCKEIRTTHSQKHPPLKNRTVKAVQLNLL